MTPRIFISYSNKNKEIAEAVCDALERLSIHCWISPRNITAGIKYAEAIVDGIDQCEIFVLILSSASNTSPQVEMEVDRAASKAKTIITFRIEDVTLSKSLQYYLGNRHWLDATNPPVTDHIHDLVMTVNKLTAQQVNGPDNLPEDPVVPVSFEDALKISPVGPTTNVVEKHPAPANPFTFGNSIKEPERFIGREAEIRQIVNRLVSSAHESTSIIGERRIGKTSLLNYLGNPKVAAGLGLTSDKFCFVYVDFQGLTDITPQRFWQRVLKKMSRSICDESLKLAIEALSAQGEFDLFDLEDLFATTKSKGQTIVLLMDEFEYITENPNFKSDFFGGLRALAIHHGLALVPSTRRELVALCHSEEIKGSPFFNIFANVVLHPFPLTDAASLVDGYLSSLEEPFAPEEKEFILRLGGGQPFFLQIAGYYLVDARLQGLKARPLFERVVADFDQQADPHFSYLWNHCTESEKITLLGILALQREKVSKKSVSHVERLQKMNPRAHLDVATLSKRGLIVETDGKYALFSPSLERWTLREIMTAPGEEETPASVEAWLRSGGREKLENAKGVLPQVKKKYWPVVSSILKEVSFEVMGATVFELLIKSLV